MVTAHRSPGVKTPGLFRFAAEPLVRLVVYLIMHDSQISRTDQHSAGDDSMVVKPLAPEEIRPGDYVAVMQVVYELPSFFWCADTLLIPPDKPIRLQFLPEDGGTPLKVRSVCLPFVLTKTASGEHRTIDLRKYRLARLNRRYAKIAWKAGKKKPARPTCV